jgi:hypothetical protein
VRPTARGYDPGMDWTSEIVGRTVVRVEALPSDGSRGFSVVFDDGRSLDVEAVHGWDYATISAELTNAETGLPAY